MIIGICGKSGSGKSTLIKLLYREEKPTKGTIMLGGINVGKLRNGSVYCSHDKRHRSVKFAF